MRRILLPLSVAFVMFIAGTTLATNVKGQPVGKAKGRPTQVKVVTMATGLNHPWSLAFLPDGDMLVTERSGKLRLMHDGALDPEPIAGVPAVHALRLSGLMEILPHPKFAENHLVYLTYTKDVGPDMVATTLARGRLEAHKLVEVKDILICDPWAGDGGSGSRLAFGTDSMLYMTTGASNGNAAQESGSLCGKILRLFTACCRGHAVSVQFRDVAVHFRVCRRGQADAGIDVPAEFVGFGTCQHAERDVAGPQVLDTSFA